MRAFGAESLTYVHELARRRRDGTDVPILEITGEMGPEEREMARRMAEEYELDDAAEPVRPR